MVKINVYSGDQLSEAIDEAISNYNWTDATGTSDKSEQWRIIYQGLLKIPNIKNPGVIFKDIHPDPVQIHLFNGSDFPAVNFDIKKSVAVIKPTFTYNYTSKFGTFTIAAESELIAYAAFQQWLKEKESGEPVTPPVVTPPVTPPEPIILLSANVKISFTDPNIGGFSSSISINDISELQILSNSAPEWKYTLIGSSTNQPISSLSELINNINDLLITVEPDEPEPDKPDITIATNMVTQQMINFNIVNGRAVGSIKFVATNNFNPYYYGKNIVNIIQFKDPNGAKIGVLKENRLNFTETERDEVISYDESMEANTRATVESFVWSSATTPTSFSNMFRIEISEAEPPKPLTSGFMGAGAAGAIAGLVLLGFIIDHKVSKR